MNKTVYDVIIIGAGASGMTTALYTARAGLNTLVLEDIMYGGQMQNTGEIENYSGFEMTNGEKLSDDMFEQIERQENIEYKEFLGVTGLVKNNETGVFTVGTKSNTNYYGKSVVIATGVKHRELGVDGEEEYKNKGVSYCAICDGAFFKGKHVAVVGGGNSALDEAIYLSSIVDKVTIVHRRDKLRADQILVDRALSKGNINIMYDTQVSEIDGDGESVKYVSLLKKPTNDNIALLMKANMDGVFIYVGVEPVTEPFKNDSFVGLLDEYGYVRNNPSTMGTVIKGLFAVGDVRAESVRQIASAVGDGAIAGINIKRYIETI